MSQLDCLVFMPFEGQRSFVYHTAIAEAVEELNEEYSRDPGLSIELHHVRADEVAAPNSTDKVAQIRALIQQCDIVIADISGWNPNVMWELGYSAAMDKRLIVVCEKTDEELPFNVRTIDIIWYTFDFDGMDALKSRLITVLESHVPRVHKEKNSLVGHEEYMAAREQVMSTLKIIPQNSLLMGLALKELNQVGVRFEALSRGTFILSNQKPYEEIIEYYCAYLSQLQGTDCEFDVVSNLNFWNEITDRGDDYRYLNANLDAVDKGAHLRRVILVNSKEYPDRNLSGEPLYRNILRDFGEAAKKMGGRLETKLLFSESYIADRKSLSNFRILRKGSELLLFKPKYEEKNKDKNGRMVHTQFLYRDADMTGIRYEHIHLTEIDEHERKFRQAWAKGVELSEEHYSR